jgi:hypothetical protein
MSVLGRDMPMGPFFFGAELWTSNDTLTTPVEKRPSDIKFLKMILLQFRIEKPAELRKGLLKQYELQVVDYVTK